MRDDTLFSPEVARESLNLPTRRARGQPGIAARHAAGVGRGPGADRVHRLRPDALAARRMARDDLSVFAVSQPAQGRGGMRLGLLVIRRFVSRANRADRGVEVYPRSAR
jgi:hypothetical protein